MPEKKELIDRLSDQAKRLLIQEAVDAADVFFTDDDLAKLSKSIVKSMARELRDAGLKEVRNRQAELTQRFTESVMPTAEQHLNEQIGLCAERIERMAESARQALREKAEEIAEQASRECVDEAVRQAEEAMAEAVAEMRSEFRSTAAKALSEWAAERSAKTRETRRTEMEGLLKEETERISAEADRQCAEAVEADREFVRRTADRAVALLGRMAEERLAAPAAVEATPEENEAPAPNAELLEWKAAERTSFNLPGAIKSALALPNGRVVLVARRGDTEKVVTAKDLRTDGVSLEPSRARGERCDLVRTDHEILESDLLVLGRNDSSFFLRDPLSGRQLDSEVFQGTLVAVSDDPKRPLLMTVDADGGLYRICQICEQGAQELEVFRTNSLPSGHMPFAVAAAADGGNLIVSTGNSGKSLSVHESGNEPSRVELPFEPDRYAPHGQVFMSAEGTRLYVPYSGLLSESGAMAEVRLSGSRIDSVRVVDLEEGQQAIMSAGFDREAGRLCLSTWGRGEAQVTVFDLNLMASLGTVFRRSFDRFTRVVADMRGTDVVVALGGGEETAELALYALA